MKSAKPDFTVSARKRTIVFSVCLIGFIGCGYVKSGQWDDDSGNWDRAFGQFGQSVPKEWRVVHSRYWRNPHFTYEGGYYFQIRVSPEGRHLLIQPDYVRLKPEKAEMQGPCAPRPSWFAPKGFAQYEIWGAKEGTPNYRLLIDGHGSDVFLMDCQY